MSDVGLGLAHIAMEHAEEAKQLLDRLRKQSKGGGNADSLLFVRSAKQLMALQEVTHDSVLVVGVHAPSSDELQSTAGRTLAEITELASRLSAALRDTLDVAIMRTDNSKSASSSSHQKYRYSVTIYRGSSAVHHNSTGALILPAGEVPFSVDTAGQVLPLDSADSAGGISISAVTEEVQRLADEFMQQHDLQAGSTSTMSARVSVMLAKATHFLRFVCSLCVLIPPFDAHSLLYH